MQGLSADSGAELTVPMIAKIAEIVVFFQLEVRSKFFCGFLLGFRPCLCSLSSVPSQSSLQERTESMDVQQDKYLQWLTDYWTEGVGVQCNAMKDGEATIATIERMLRETFELHALWELSPDTPGALQTNQVIMEFLTQWRDRWSVKRDELAGYVANGECNLGKKCLLRFLPLASAAMKLATSAFRARSSSATTTAEFSARKLNNPPGMTQVRNGVESRLTYSQWFIVFSKNQPDEKVRELFEWLRRHLVKWRDWRDPDVLDSIVLKAIVTVCCIQKTGPDDVKKFLYTVAIRSLIDNVRRAKRAQNIVVEQVESLDELTYSDESNEIPQASLDGVALTLIAAMKQRLSNHEEFDAEMYFANKVEGLKPVDAVQKVFYLLGRETLTKKPPSDVSRDVIRQVDKIRLDTYSESARS